MRSFQVQQRYVLGAMIFLVLAAIYAQRTTFPLLLTQMVYIPNVGVDLVESNGEMICPADTSHYFTSPNGTLHSTVKNNDRFDWSQQLQGMILSSFYGGYITSQIPGGIISQKYGGKRVLVICTLLYGIVIALSPLAVAIGDATGLIITRILTGFLQGPSISCIFTLLTRWYPVEERGRSTAIVFIGANTGAFVSSYLVGIVMKETGRWDIAFYGLAAITIAISFLFAFLCFETPQNHPFISATEKEFLKLKIADDVAMKKNDLPPTPWKKIFSSVPVIALLISTFLMTYSVDIINLGLPKYLNDVLHLPIKRNSFFNSLARVINIFVALFSGFLVDWLHVKRNISLTSVRKIFVCLETIYPAIFAIAASYSGCNEALVVTFLTISISGQAFDVAGLVVNLVDLSPNYVGSLNALFQMMHSLAAVFAPYSVGVLAPHAFMSEWRILFWITFTAYLGVAAIFTAFGSGKVQAWNTPQKSIQSA